MKNFLKRLFFWDSPAQGAFFGMTMLMALPWIYFTFLCVLLAKEDMRIGNPSDVIKLIFAGISLYTLFVYTKSLGQAISPQIHWTWRMLRWGYIWVIFLLLSVFDFHAMFSFCVLLFLFGSGFLFPSGGAKWRNLAIVFLWPMGFTGLCLMFAYGVLPIYTLICELSLGPLSLYSDFKWITALQDFFMISGVGWKWLAIITFLCLFAGYILQAQALCNFWKVSSKELLSKRAIFVLVLCLLIYLVSLPFALFEEAKYKHSRRKLEQHFGKAISVQTLENEYCWGGQASEQSWKELSQAVNNMTSDRKENFLSYYNLSYYNYKDIDPLASELEGELYKKWEAFYLRQKEIEYINDFLGEIPPTPRKWRDFELILCGFGFHDLLLLDDCFDAQLWQLRFAMKNQDANNALRLFSRMQNICSYLYKDGSSSYLNAQKKYLLALCRFIESGLADGQWVDSQLDLFRKLEADSASLEERIQFNAVVCLCDSFDGIAHRLGETIAEGAELSQLRWFFPQTWWPHSAKANAILRALGDYLSTGTTSPANSSEKISKRTIARIGNLLKRANVQVSCAKVLLEAEKIKRQTGSYPKEMPSLPTDHFTQKPLQYDVGTFEFETEYVYITVPKESEENGCTIEDCECLEDWVNPGRKKTRKTANMVRVFSPGENLEKNYDDICFFIIINH